MLKIIIAHAKFEEHQSKNKNNQVIEWNEVLTIRQTDGRIHRRPAQKH